MHGSDNKEHFWQKPADGEGKQEQKEARILPLEEYQRIVDSMYPGIALFARDTNLPSERAALYRTGMLIREKGFTDASIRFMGMVATHRFVILSNHMTDMTAFEHGTNWGLFTARRDARFKVLGQTVHEGKVGIFLLHLPDDDTWKVYRNTVFQIDDQLLEMAVQRFRAKCLTPPVQELTTKAWLDRCAPPLGMNDEGLFWPLTDKAPWERITEEDCCAAKYYQLSENALLKHTADDRYFTLDLFDGSWHENRVLAAEFAHGEVCRYREIPLADSFPTAEYGPDVREILLGRSEECGVRFRDPRVSRKHALLMRQEGGWIIRDLDSTNGTFVNDEPVKERKLRFNDRIRIGDGCVLFKGTAIQIREGDRTQFRALPSGE